MTHVSKIILYLFPVLLVFGSCEKTEQETISGNTPPPDQTIEEVTIRNYVTRSYILTLGREPDATEFQSAVTLLLQTRMDSLSRQQFLNDVFDDPDYLRHLYDEQRIDLLNNVDTSEFTFWIGIFNALLQDSSNLFQWPYIESEIDRMERLQEAYGLFVNETIDIDELQRRMCDNYLYDQINMGTANFVISTFQHLINRNPTQAEQSSGISMVEGNNSILFLTAGASKPDYLNIITGTGNYYEGQIIRLYQKFLNRLPNSQEMALATSRYQSTQDYTSVQRDLLSSDEFIGIE